jgi:hypothetical protein
LQSASVAQQPGSGVCVHLFAMQMSSVHVLPSLQSAFVTQQFGVFVFVQVPARRLQTPTLQTLNSLQSSSAVQQFVLVVYAQRFVVVLHVTVLQSSVVQSAST